MPAQRDDSGRLGTPTTSLGGSLGEAPARFRRVPGRTGRANAAPHRHADDGQEHKLLPGAAGGKFTASHARVMPIRCRRRAQLAAERLPTIPAATEPKPALTVGRRILGAGPTER